MLALTLALAGVGVAACEDDPPQCVTPMVAVDHGYNYTYTAYYTIMAGKTPVMVPYQATAHHYDWKCEEQQ